MDDYKFITDPVTKKKYLTNSKQGIKILQQLLNYNPKNKSKKRKRNENLNVNLRKTEDKRNLDIVTIPDNMEVITFTSPGKILTWKEAEFFWQFIYNFSELISNKDFTNVIFPISKYLIIKTHKNKIPEYNLSFYPSKILGLFNTQNTEWFSKNIQGHDCNYGSCPSSGMFTEKCEGCGPNIKEKITLGTDNQNYKLSQLLYLIHQQLQSNFNNNLVRIFLFCCSEISNPIIKHEKNIKKKRGVYIIDLANNIDDIEDNFFKFIQKLGNTKNKKPLQISILCHGEIIFK